MIKLPTSIGSLKKQENSRKTSTSASLTAKTFEWVDHSKLWKILKEMGIPDHLTCLPRYLYAGKEVTIRTRHGTMDRFEIGKGVCKGVYCHLAYLTYMQILNARLDKAKAGIKNSRRNINNLRYGDDTTLTAQRE